MRMEQDTPSYCHLGTEVYLLQQTALSGVLKKDYAQRQEVVDLQLWVPILGKAQIPVDPNSHPLPNIQLASGNSWPRS